MINTDLTSLWQFEHQFESHANFKITAGALELWMSREPREWQFRYNYSNPNENQDDINLERFNNLDSMSNEFELCRFIDSLDSTSIQIKPRLADRSIVAKPKNTVFLPSKQEVVIYVSTPVWLGFYLPNQKQVLFELPTQQLSDTWFGVSPNKGEFCYASQFSGRLDIDALPRRASRIITPIRVKNNADSNLSLEKFAIPTNWLSVYLNQKSELWTQMLTVVCEKELADTRAYIDKTEHSSIVNSQLVSPPRMTDQDGFLLKAVNILFF